MNIEYSQGLWIYKKLDKNNKTYYVRGYSGSFRKFKMGKENAEFLIAQHPDILIDQT